MKKLWGILVISFILLMMFLLMSLIPPLKDFHTKKISPPVSANNPNRPARIVSLSPNLTEILFAMGLGERIAAVSSDSDYPPAAVDRQKVGTFWQPNTEAIIAIKPDLVITERFEQQRAVADSLNRLGYKVLTLKIEKIEDLFAAIQKIGDAIGCERQGRELAENIKNQLNDLKTKSVSINKVKVLWVVQPEPLRVAGRDTFVNELIELAGGENAIGQTIQKYPPISTEELLAGGAEVIIQSAMSKNNIAEQQRAAETFWSRFANLPAVRNHRIYVVNPDTVLRLGPRLPQGVGMIAKCLHPNIFKQSTGTTQR